MSRHALCLACCVLGLILSGPVFGQVLPGIDPTLRSGEPPPLKKEMPVKPAPPARELLPVPSLPSGDQEGKLPVIQVFVREIQVTGSTVFSPEALKAVTAPFENRRMTTEDLEEVRRALTLLYVKNGYINSGAVIPDQAVSEGIIHIKIIEGELSGIEVEGATHFFPFYLKKRIELSAGPPLNVNPLRERLQILLQDNRITRLNSELKPGLKPGESVLHLRMEEASPYKAWAEFNNFQNPTVGAERGLATVSHQNLLGLGDIFNFTYGQSEGVDPLIDTNYTLPLTPQDTQFFAGYRRTKFTVVEAPFNTLNIQNDSEIITLTLRHPVFRTPTQEFSLALTGEHLQNLSSLGGVPFSFIRGSTSDGVSIVSALRFAQEYTKRGPAQVLAFRSRFSMGLDVLDATNNRQGPNDPDSHFFVWLGQAQIAHRFDPLGIQLISGLTLQLSNDSLFPLEQFAVGGRYSVRGYRENTFVRDNAFLFNLEGRVPVLQKTWVLDSVYLAPFLDVGKSWNTEFSDPITTTLASIGLGLRASILQRAQYNIYWGVPLNHVPSLGGNMQDDGIHMQFVVNILD